MARKSLPFVDRCSRQQHRGHHISVIVAVNRRRRETLGHNLHWVRRGPCVCVPACLIGLRIGCGW